MYNIKHNGHNGKSTITCYYWEPEINPIGIVYFAHGVTEYAKRHSELLQLLSIQGYVVVANDHMGHGESTNDHRACFIGTKKESGWDCACEDAYNCIVAMKERYGTNLPVYGIGFSLGSFIVRTIAIKYPDLFKAVVLIGTGDQGAIALSLGKHIAKSECEKHGSTNKTTQIDKLTFETYNKKFEQSTRADWLCADKTALFMYLEDEQCTDGFTAGLFYDLLCGMEFTGKPSNIAKMNKTTKILLLSGKCDPVGDFTKGVNALQKKMRKAGLNVTSKFYDDMRHDILHEKCYRDVQVEIINFLLKAYRDQK
jgi:alpha-beta hydrolase superfamily lysophospholipase